jgi:hypothetical protein
MPTKASKPLILVAALTAFLATASIRAATPSEGTLNGPNDSKLGQRASLSYTGAAVYGALAINQLAAGPYCATTPVAPPPQCDSFTLHLNLPAGWETRNAGKVLAKLLVNVDWSDAPQGSTMDLDVLVFDSEGSQVGSGENDNNASAIPHEDVTVDRVSSGDYRIIVAGIVGGAPSYKATVKLVYAKDERINTILDRTLLFSPATIVNPSLFGGEPAVTTDRSNPKAWWIDWPIGFRSNTGILTRSLDGGDTFRLMTNPRCPFRRKPGCLTLGGGDTMTAVSKSGVVYWADQEILANEAVSVSLDHGVTWPADHENAITSLDVENDRQWLATDGDLRAYISATTATGTGLARTEDAGKTWQAIQPIRGEVPSASAPMVVDETGGKLNGTLYMLGRDLSLHVSRDHGNTFTNWPDGDHPNTGPAGDSGGTPLGTPPPWMSIDRAGNLYVAWTDASDGIVRLSTMLASSPANAGAKLGSTWSKPVKVSIPPAVSTIFTQVAAGDAGRVAIAYQGAATKSSPASMPAGTPWYVYVAISTDALCQWKKACPEGPSFIQNQLSARTNHIGNICTSGTACVAIPNADRNLADFFDLDVDAAGRVGVTWTDDNHGVVFDPTTARGGYISFAKVVGGPSLTASVGSFRPASGSTLTAAGGRGLAKKGDAKWPINDSGGTDFPTLDLLGQSVSSTASSMKISVDLASTKDLSLGLGAGYEAQHVKYLTRWAHGQDVYFVAADATGDETTFYGGKVDSNDEMLRTSVTSVYGTKYVRDFDVTGKIEDGKITFEVPFTAVGNLRKGDRIFSLQSFTMVGLTDALQSVYTSPDTIDVTPPMDYQVGATSASVLPAKVQPKKPASGSTGNEKPGKGLAATGVSGETAGVMLVAAAAALVALRSRRRGFAKG